MVATVCGDRVLGIMSSDDLQIYDGRYLSFQSYTQRSQSHAERRPQSHTERSPQSHTERSPTSKTERSPRSHTERSPTSKTERSPQSHTERSPQSNTERRPQSYTGRKSGSVCCMSAGSHSWRSSCSLSKTATDDRTVRSSISSRARPIKDHEGDPFLAVDLLGDLSNYQPIRRADSRLMFQEDKLSVSSLRSAPAHTKRRSEMLTGELCRTLVNIARPASCISLPRVVSRPNLRVSRPFKHATNTPVCPTYFVVPGHALIENTSLALEVMNRIFLDPSPPQTGNRRGRLLKARLKCLEPVSLTAPTIHQCRGIVADEEWVCDHWVGWVYPGLEPEKILRYQCGASASDPALLQGGRETRSYSACGSRTLQRMRDVYSGCYLPKKVMESTKNLGYISESLHQTSEASSPDPSLGSGYSPHIVPDCV